mmetsp:Transcript_24360/g.56143  ORF Transcript_24360/g.56143 Transcript_24360/m.56143 type:complete len:84 (-) Transcript_24360:904-1155(-)
MALEAAVCRVQRLRQLSEAAKAAPEAADKETAHDSQQLDRRLRKHNPAGLQLAMERLQVDPVLTWHESPVDRELQGRSSRSPP